tara:strand:+ start:405 stop:512 length:108 start_codon:yes stop_codon:yes gene_type:complete
MWTLIAIFSLYISLGIYFEYQNKKEDKEEHKRNSS